MRFSYKLLAPLFLAIFFSNAMGADLRIGVVDTERILRESDPAIKAEKKIEKEFAARDQQIKDMTQQVKDIQSYLDKEGVTLQDAERRNKERELDNLNTDLQRAQREFREDLNLRKNDELVIVLEQANKAIQKIAESEKYDLILQEAVYRNPKIDITDKVLQYLSQASPAAKTDTKSDANLDKKPDMKLDSVPDATSVGK